MTGYAFVPLNPDILRRHAGDFLAVAADQEWEYWNLEHFLVDLPGKWEFSFATELGGRTIGYAVLSRPSSERVHVHHFMLASGYRNRGLGSLMLSHAEKLARSAGAVKMSLKVNRQASNARRFYVRHGFHEFSADNAEYLSMVKSLGMVVAIHQPNYLPWLGYFAKIAQAERFIFLDDVQFSKGGYINRVQVLGGGQGRWLTIPVTVRLGDPINKIRPRDEKWLKSHLDFFRNEYRRAARFRQVWPELADIFAAVPCGGDLAAINQFLITALAGRLGLDCVFARSSEFAVAGSADDRLVELVAAIAPGGTYLSGKGGAKYQDPVKFASAGLAFAYQNFVHPQYRQEPLTAGSFVAGLSVVDAVMHLGWEGASSLLLGVAQ